MSRFARTTDQRGISTLELTMAMPLVVFAMLFLIGMGHALISKQHAVVGGQFAAHHQRVREAAPSAAMVGKVVSASEEAFRLSGGGDETISYMASATPRKGLIAEKYSLNASASKYQTSRVTNACVPHCKPFDAFARILSPELITGIIFSGSSTSLSKDDLLSIVAGKGNKRRRQKPDGAVAVSPGRKGPATADPGKPAAPATGGGGGGKPPARPPGGTAGTGDDGKPDDNGNGQPGDGKKQPRPSPTPARARSPIDQVNEWERTGKIKGTLDRLKKDLMSPDNGTRLGAEAEVRELEREIAAGRTPEVRGAQAGPDQPDYEVKARTKRFENQKNAQNFFNDRINKANDQFKGQNGRGRIVIDLGEATTIEGKPITREAARNLVKQALSKGGRGTNITKVVVKDGNGRVIYEGLGG